MSSDRPKRNAPKNEEVLQAIYNLTHPKPRGRGGGRPKGSGGAGGSQCKRGAGISLTLYPSRKRGPLKGAAKCHAADRMNKDRDPAARQRWEAQQAAVAARKEQQKQADAARQQRLRQQQALEQLRVVKGCLTELAALGPAAGPAGLPELPQALPGLLAHLEEMEVVLSSARPATTPAAGTAGAQAVGGASQ